MEAEKQVNAVVNDDQSALVAVGVYANMVPQTVDSIDPEIVTRSGHKAEYLFGLCIDHDITVRQLDTLVEVKEEYSVPINYQASLMSDYNLDASDVVEIVETRENFERKLTLQSIAQLHETFADLPLDADNMQVRIDEIFEVTGVRNSHYIVKQNAIKSLILTAKGMDINTLDAALAMVEAPADHY